MIYFATGSGKVEDAQRAGLLGQMLVPGKTAHRHGVECAIDNGCFRPPGSKPWDPDVWKTQLDRLLETTRAEDLRFVVCPDVVCDADATAAMWEEYSQPLIARGLPVAWVAQNGAEPDDIPVHARAVFLGGDTEWKVGIEARTIAHYAKLCQKWVHMGRVNTISRLRYAAAIGCDSVDGTYLKYGPDNNLPILLRWMNEINRPTLLDGNHSGLPLAPPPDTDTLIRLPMKP